ncbi:unnamed protein product [marine sediment metagenome]|uniref:Uncharacterized protein n=1 Tax=marine sediment metagenome TaxID=412755 RepID=X1FBH4_9ZZZZ
MKFIDILIGVILVVIGLVMITARLVSGSFSVTEILFMAGIILSVIIYYYGRIESERIKDMAYLVSVLN